MNFLNSLRALIREYRPTSGEHEAALANVAAEKVEPPVAAAWAHLAATRLFAHAGLSSCRSSLSDAAKIQILMAGGLAKLYEQSRGEPFKVETFVAAVTGFDEKLVFEISNEFALKMQAIGERAKGDADSILSKFATTGATPH